MLGGSTTCASADRDRAQRRKHNSKSNTVCCKGHRDCVSELEGKVNNWKDKLDQALRKLKERNLLKR